MNEKLQETLSNIIVSAQDVGSDVYAFAMEQSPLLVQEVITWGIFRNLLWAGVNIFIVALIVIGTFLLDRNMKKSTKKGITTHFLESLDDMEPIWIFYLLGVIAAFCIICINCNQFVSHIEMATKAYLTPRLYFLEIVQGLM